MKGSIQEILLQINDGDKLYKTHTIRKTGEIEIIPVLIKNVYFETDPISKKIIGANYIVDGTNEVLYPSNLKRLYHKTYSDAVEAIKRQKLITEKKKLMKEYEAKLNNEMNIENNIIVK